MDLRWARTLWHRLIQESPRESVLEVMAELVRNHLVLGYGLKSVPVPGKLPYSEGIYDRAVETLMAMPMDEKELFEAEALYLLELSKHPNLNVKRAAQYAILSSPVTLLRLLPLLEEKQIEYGEFVTLINEVTEGHFVIAKKLAKVEAETVNEMEMISANQVVMESAFVSDSSDELEKKQDSNTELEANSEAATGLGEETLTE